MSREYCPWCGRVGCQDENCKPVKYTTCECGGDVEIIYYSRRQTLDCDSCDYLEVVE